MSRVEDILGIKPKERARYVVKKNGETENLNINKIKKCIDWCCEGLDVNPMELESSVDAILNEGVTTSQIQKNLIHHATTLADKESPDWTIVAGRAMTMERWNSTRAYDKTFPAFIEQMIELRIYDLKMISNYTALEIEQLGLLIDKEKDLEYSVSATINAEHKYLQQGECIQQMHMMNAMCVANVETSDNRLRVAKLFYKALSNRTSSLATPWLSNLRKGGNISSCFIYATDDDKDSIADNIRRVINTSAAGGGMGMSLAKIRAAGSSVGGNKGASKGVVSYIKVLNDIAVWIDQSGKRAGAITVALPIWHKDIGAFLEIQDDNKDPRNQSFDVFMQVGMFDLFMERSESNAPWHTFCPYEVKQVLGIDLTESFDKKFRLNYSLCEQAYKEGQLENVYVYTKPKDLVKIFMKKWMDRGTPYIAFMDEINRQNPNKHEGNIPCVNLCTESFSNVLVDEYGHSCNLASIVAGRMNTLDDFRKEARVITRMLSNGILITNNPDPIAAAHNHRYSTVGTGVMGVHDWLIKQKTGYHDHEALTSLFEHVQYGAIEESIQLAKERGAYPAFAGSDWESGAMIEKFDKGSVTSLDWKGLQSGIDAYGVHNSQLTSPAPNTSTSLLMDSSAGVLPVYAPFFLDDNAVGATPVAGMFLKEYPEAYEHTQVKHNQAELALAVGAMQKHVDTGISAEYIFDRNDDNLNAKTLYNLLLTAWKAKTKAMYYVRSQKRVIACEACEA